MEKILFFTHETSKSGAPLVLFYFLQWLKKNHPDIKITVVTLKGGILSEDFKKVSDKFINLTQGEIKPPTFFQMLSEKVSHRIGALDKKESQTNRIVNDLAKQNFSLIYANSVATIPIASSIKLLNPKIKLVVHVHELKTVIDILLPNFKQYISNIDSFIAVSSIVKKNLITKYGIRPQLITTIYEFTPLQNRLDKLEEGTFTIGGAGTVDWRKGVDYFIQVAFNVSKIMPLIKIHWVWAGKIDQVQKIIMTKDIEKAGLVRKVIFIGEKEDLRKYFSNIDVFLLPSREDPFPLVAIEAAMNRVPIVCFEDATGTAEILKKGGGKIVPYMDINAMSEAIIDYYKNKDKRLMDGNDAQRLFSAFTPENICPKIFNYLKTL